MWITVQKREESERFYANFGSSEELDLLAKARKVHLHGHVMKEKG